MIIFSALICTELSAREVDSLANEERILGYQGHLDTQDQLEKKRLSDLHQLKEWRAAWNDLQKKSLEKYKIDKSKQEETLDETSSEYHEHIKGKLHNLQISEWARSQYVEKRNINRIKNRKQVLLTEEVELQLVPDPERVDWKKRKLFGSKSTASAGRPSSGGGDFAPPPPPSSSFPPSASPPEFYESMDDIPPPPPPVEPGLFDDGAPPPPPPPLFDDN